MKRIVLLSVVFAAVAIAPLATVAPSNAAGPGQYSAPEWWPLRGSNLVGCARNSPGAVCEGNYHPVWAIDIQAPEGQAIYASGAGLAKVFENSTGCSGYGRAVVVEHGGSTKSLYGHMSNFSAAIQASPGGVWVDQNTIIGYIGHTGSVSNCSYNHLHYEETTNGSFWASATNPGTFKACHGATAKTYPNEWGQTSWNGLPGHTYTARNDNTTCGVGNGSFVVTPDGRVWRIVGGAPLYIDNWAPFGGPQPTTAVPNLDAFAAKPADGTFITTAPSGRVRRFVGGAPLYIDNWAPFGGPQPTLTVNDGSIEAGTDYSFGHVNRVPADGSFIDIAPRGRVFRFVGGAPVYISDWGPLGGAQPSVRVNDGSIESGTEYSFGHVNRVPADGSFIDIAPRGRVFRFVGGAPLYISDWGPLGGATPSVRVNDASIEVGTSYSYGHVNRVPADGSFIDIAPRGRVFRFVGGAPVYISDWGPLGGAKPSVRVNDNSIETPTSYSYGHVNPTPADGSFVRGLPSQRVYRFVGGSPLYIDSWSPFGGQQPHTELNDASIGAGTSFSFGHVNPVPAPGSAAQGMPSGQYWTFTDLGCRAASTSAVAGAVVVNDGSVRSVPLCVSVHWSTSEDERLAQLRIFYGYDSNEELAKFGVLVLAFINAIDPQPSPTPVVLGPPGNATTDTIFWQPNELATLDAVKSRWVLNDEDAHRWGFMVLSFIAAIQGH